MNTRVYASFFTGVLIITMLLLAGCRRADVVAQPTALPSATATPRSTALPAVATEVPLGTEGNPLKMVIRPFADRARAQNSVGSLEQAVAEQSGLVLDIELVNRYAEALAALCDLSVPSAVWLDGVAYMAAISQNCGRPELQVERDTSAGLKTASAIDLVVRSSLGISGLSGLSGRTYCRLNVEDFTTWLAPSLLMQANAFDPAGDFEAVLDFDDQDEMVSALISGECDAAALPEGTLDDANGDIGDEVEVLLTSPAFPFDMLMYPIGVPLNVRITLNETLINLASTGAVSDALSDLFGLEAVSRVHEDELNAFRDFMGSTGLDFSQLGR